MNERDMSLLKAVSEAVKEQLSAIHSRYEAALAQQSDEINRLRGLVEKSEQSAPDEQAIAASVLAQITIPAAPVLPDIAKMVKDAVAEIPVPDSPVLPDFESMVQRAVSAIKVPQPEALPDIAQMVKDAVAEMPKPEDGEPGEDGKDALQLEIMPSIDPEKAYQRGTYAIHQGGLWRSYQKTTGMKGWECLVDGISDIVITQRDERNFTVTAIKSSGDRTEKTFSVPVMIYRDIFKDGEKYFPGDSVTWGGSVWYCNEATGDKPGEDGSKGWKLAVKRGRDARAK
ncbi:phage portal protein [Pantoea graminicola]|uniref:phage portal protein n=1 Tax=Pantoea sp. ARC607 TaxID=2027922 RepID=UPI000DA99B0C|nr:phage portal protein [Pantoea sp. ARC607]PZL93180.1 phage portal protein [Pantoea sp. ARC607]